MCVGGGGGGGVENVRDNLKKLLIWDKVSNTGHLISLPVPPRINIYNIPHPATLDLFLCIIVRCYSSSGHNVLSKLSPTS